MCLFEWEKRTKQMWPLVEPQRCQLLLPKWTSPRDAASFSFLPCWWCQNSFICVCSWAEYSWAPLLEPCASPSSHCSQSSVFILLPKQVESGGCLAHVLDHFTYPASCLLLSRGGKCCITHYLINQLQLPSTEDDRKKEGISYRWKKNVYF